MKKKNFLKNPAFYYWLFVAIAVLELLVSVLGLFINISNRSRDAAISNIFLSVLAIALMSLPRYLKEKYHFKFKGWIEILVLVFLFAAIILGFVQEYYVHLRGFDKAVHLLSGIVLYLVAFEITHIYSNYIQKKKNESIPALFTIIFSFTLSITLLVLWEFYEFIADTISYNLLSSPTNMQRYQWISESNFFPQSHGLLDTMLDLLIGALGSLAGSTILFFILRRHEKQGQSITNVLSDKEI